MQTIRVAMVGQPNVGKTSLLNALSHTKLKVGNFAGVTVEKTEVVMRYCSEATCEEYELRFTDLPGAYSLNDYTIEEKVTKEFLDSGEFDVVLNVIDATHLQRNLLLTLQLLENGHKTLIALNMIDEAQKEGVTIDTKQLSKILGVAVVAVSAHQKEGIEQLLEAIIKVYQENQSSPKLVYSDFIEEEIEKLVHFFEQKNYQSTLPYRNLAIKLLQEDTTIYKKIHEEPIWITLQPLLQRAQEHIALHAGSKNFREIFADEHFAFAKGARMEVVKRHLDTTDDTTQRIDAILINKWLGVPIFLFLMWLLFQATFTIGEIPMGWIEAVFGWLLEQTKDLLGDTQVASLIADGVIGGVGAVVSFLPNIIILFVGIALLESTGYMARVAFLLDGFFHKFGLHGKSFIPLVTGFGCSVPAYMAARTLKNEKDRLITLFVIGFMSCGARLPIYVLFAGAFFPQDQAGNILFLIYISGALLGLIMAKVLKTFVFKGEDEPFVMEMPKYRLPSPKLIWHTVYTQAKSYLQKAGTYILVASIAVWAASNYPKQPQLQATYAKMIEVADEDTKYILSQQLNAKLLEQSYLGQIGKATQPFFAPLGFDWKMTVALESGLAAKEVVVSTLGVLYAVGNSSPQDDWQLRKTLRNEIPLPSAIAFIVFVMLYLPCFAASAVFTKEAGGWRYLIYLFIMTTTVAWILSFIANRLTGWVIAL